jgi:hypothetical protein
MAVSVVNGFVCYSSCDVGKAKKGQDPHPATGLANADQNSAPSSLGPSLGRADQPAVVFGGSLSRTSGVDSVKAIESVAQSSDPATLSRSKFSVDLLA